MNTMTSPRRLRPHRSPRLAMLSSIMCIVFPLLAVITVGVIVHDATNQLNTAWTEASTP